MWNIFNQGWIGSVIGLIGILVAIFTYKRSNMGPRMVYTWSSMMIIGKKEVTPEEIEILYKGLRVQRVIKTEIVLWNSGNKTIDGSNIVENDPLRFEFNNYAQVMRATIISRTKEFNDVKFNFKDEDKNVIYLEFEYLDPQDGVRIEILHTDYNKYPRVLGSIKGLPTGLIYVGDKSKQIKERSQFLMGFSKVFKRKFFSEAILLFTMFVGFGFLVGGLYNWVKFEELVAAGEKRYALIIIFGYLFNGCLYLYLPLRYYWKRRRRYPKKLDNDN